MAYIKDKEDGIETVGELIESLLRFPRDMRVVSGFGGSLKVCRLESEEYEYDYPCSVIEVEHD